MTRTTRPRGWPWQKRFGAAFTPEDVGSFWLNEIPLLHTCTAERVAYRNLCAGIPPPGSATWRNPYREWIGAQIRADYFGYANPGRPERAAEWAWRDASISHVKNGIYGKMWMAAMLAAAARRGPWTRCEGADRLWVLINSLPARILQAMAALATGRHLSYTWDDWRRNG